MRFVTFITGLMLLAWTAAPVQAQSSALTGTVQDQSGLPLPGATILITGAAGTVLAATHSQGDGSWAVRSLPEGAVRLTIQLSGFRPESRDIAGTAIGQPLVVRLAVGGYASEVTVTASRDERTLASVPASVGVVSGGVLENAPGVNLVETLKYVPGVAAGDVSGVDDLRISIRGAGIRAGFGSRGVVLMTDGFPVTEPDGQTPHFDGQIDLANAARIEVVKGPSSALYGGAALGGVVNVVTRAPVRTPGVTMRAEGGSFDFAKAHVAGSSGAGPLVIGGTFSYTTIDGFRDHNSLRNWAGSARADWTKERSRAVFTFLGTDASLDLPGTLDREQFEADPSQVRPVYVINDWGRENTLYRFGGRYEHHLGNGQTVEFGSYGQTRDLFHPIFVVIDQDAWRYVVNGRYRLVRGRHALTTGADVDVQWVDDRWFVNAGGRPAFQIRNDDNTVSNAGFYAQDEIMLGGVGSLTVGVRADRIRYELVDLLPADGDSTDQRTFTRVSPKIGLTARLRGDLVAYGNVSTGFEAPTLGEVRLPGGFNELVEPQKSVSVEGGLRGQSGMLSFDAAVYRMVVDDEILPETIDNVTVYRNVAKATHTGIELSVRARATRALSIEGTYGYSRFMLDDFGVFSGNRLPGIPAHMGTTRVSYVDPRGWDAAAAVVFAGKAYVNDTNAEAADGYAVLSASCGYRIKGVRVFARGENLGDALYTNRVQVNDASGFYYYPAPGRHASAGVEWSW
ncbi:MAG TPA: TonB-dependent receptor [Vicinamibacterales bacterium]|nr:TonB-dependent receptor [Vicinamibacterales bacterium]